MQISEVWIGSFPKANLNVYSCPGLFYGGCHGDDEQVVFAELREIVEETIALYKQDGKPLPPATSGKDYANRMLELV